MQPDLGALAAKVKKACEHLMLDAVFIGSCLTKLKIIIDPTCDTAWTDGVHLGYNPEYVASLSHGELMGLLFHEVLHVTNGHCWRRKGRDPEVWNESCDEAINPVIVSGGYQLPQGGLMTPKYRGKSAEYIYHQMQQDKAAQAQNQSPSASSSNKEAGEGSGSKGEKPSDEPGAGKPEEGAGKASGQPSKGDGKDSSKGAGPDGTGPQQDSAGDSGDGKPDEKPQEDGKGEGKDDASKGKPQGEGEKPTPKGQPKKPRPAGEVRDAPSGTDLDKLEAEWKVVIDQAAKSARMMGKFPGDLAAMVPQMLKPTVDWRSVLRSFFEQSWNAVDYTWRLPNTRYLSQGIYLPRLSSETIPCLVIFEDISGSVPLNMKSAFQAEERVIIEEIQPQEAWLGYCDAKVHEKLTRLYNPGDDIKVITVTAGGTDFRPAFEWVEKQGLTPVAFVYLTDLEGKFPAKAPDYPVLWVTPPTTLTVPFGDIVEMRD